ncbi:unnamed protein product [Polarella glacialis]|uniref:Uncharacterized protein n=1 Tax=Polarella glacialis TaxID=89957 RepID=A0A813KVQ7_POLGL|nr:unnamed protein product [Polarella glacialis]CAE8709451.1 unnamed protein product [Polarella glacialis]
MSVDAVAATTCGTGPTAADGRFGKGLADLRLDDPEMHRQAVKSLFSERTFLSQFHLAADTVQAPCRRWSKAACGKWGVQKGGGGSAGSGFGRGRFAWAVGGASDGLGSDLRVASMSLLDFEELKRAEVAAQRSNRGSSKVSAPLPMDVDDAEEGILLSSDDEALCLLGSAAFASDSELQKDASLTRAASVTAVSVVGDQAMADGETSSQTGPVTTRSHRSRLQEALSTPPARRTTQPATSALKMAISAEAVPQAPAAVRILAKSGDASIEVIGPLVDEASSASIFSPRDARAAAAAARRGTASRPPAVPGASACRPLRLG